ncbi:hypothetical protein [Odoribacter splanchnicus]|uniref:hypothetical protein n=1 Tax=Odoribacter splanchnicus TaxID=28118 RepID=UPI0011C11E2D|nr:hypothetical protein [Odoribacter splanchnicus]MBV4277720.1 hypothetical protein [Odoribacter splanchnicus]MBV4402508.1 hypothetical protein [Odoribacter splanchnicus]MBV4411154.1 hypothetical protein [Odoribacter splanchnicus]
MALSFWVFWGGPYRHYYNFVHERTLIHRRLIVARRNAGETNMFVITLVPSSDARGNIGKSLENFHYLGSGD